MSTLGIIPARYASSRFPGKPLAIIQGKSMIQRVYEQAMQATLLDAVVVATDDERIFEHVATFRGNVIMTDAGHLSGTDRCAEVARQIPDYHRIVNIQGDEPFIAPEQIDRVVRPLLAQAPITTLAKTITTSEALLNTNVVKVVCAANGQALYFSRHPIPFVRAAPVAQWLQQATFYKHIGIYGFQREVLLSISELSPSAYELAEALEQLRWLENGYSIIVERTEHETVGIDTPEDLQKLLETM